MILLDSHVAIWLVGEPSRLSSYAAEMIRQNEENLFLSAASLYEIARAVERGRLQPKDPLPIFLQDLRALIQVKDVDAVIATEAAQLPDSILRDPMDRIIAATALVYRMPLVTADANIHNSRAVRCIW